MWAFMLVVSVVQIFLKISTGFIGLAVSIRSVPTPVALIHHPKAALDYFLKTEAHPDHERLKEFEKLDDYSKKEASLDQLVGAISFSLPQDRLNYVTGDCAFFLVGRLKAPRNSFNRHLSFTSEDGEHETSAQIYEAKHGQDWWAIAPGFHEGVLIVFNKPSHAANFRLFGLLERPPDVMLDLSQAQLETRYVTGRFDHGESDSEIETPTLTRTGLCDLSDHERFRACSVGYLVWNYSGKVTNDVSYRGPEGNYVDLKTPTNQSKCLQSEIIVDLEIEQKSIWADVISCAINKDAMHANFFLTGDPFSSDSMFKVAPKYKSDDSTASYHSINDETSGYKLELFMTNVRVLKSFPQRQ